MGTKQTLAPPIADAISSLSTEGRVADLFSGMGSIPLALTNQLPILANDVQKFATAFARVRFTNYEECPEDIAHILYDGFSRRKNYLEDKYKEVITAEQKVIGSGEPHKLVKFMNSSPHVGTSEEFKKRATTMKSRSGYELATLYFAGGYFSFRQATHLDALRYAIDLMKEESFWDQMVCAWLSAAGSIVNAPGHTAQFLKPTTLGMFKRIELQRSKSVWDLFTQKLTSMKPEGNFTWRQKNLVTNIAVENIFLSTEMKLVDIVYADPPYTADQYSRFYHLYETLYLYDYPESSGAGRYRDGRFTTDFSTKTKAEAAFRNLLENISSRQLPLVLSYPSNGLLNKSGARTIDILADYFYSVTAKTIRVNHSTLGASSGKQYKRAEERIYVCKP